MGLADEDSFVDLGLRPDWKDAYKHLAVTDGEVLCG